MSYTALNWQNAPTATTPVSAANLNHVEGGVVAAHYPPLVYPLGASPLDGQLYWYAAPSFQGFGTPPYDPPWLLRYRQTSNSSFHYEALSGNVNRMGSISPSSYSGTTYTSAPTGGTPPATIQLPLQGEYDVEISVELVSITGGAANQVNQLLFSFDAAAAAVDGDALKVAVCTNASGALIGAGHHTRRFRRTFGFDNVVPKVRTLNTVNTPTWANWRIAVYPILVD